MNRRDFFKTIITSILSIPLLKRIPSATAEHDFNEGPAYWITMEVGEHKYYNPVYGLDNENNK